MDLATISLLALLVAVIISCVSSVNVGLLGFSFAWVIGVYVAPQFGDELGVRGVVAGFPSDLVLTLIGVGLLFTQAQVNGTLDIVALAGVRTCRGHAALLPILFFFLTCLLSASGAGNIAAVALVAPAAMRTAQRAGVSPLLMALMVGHGSIAGGLSPFGTMGIIADRNLQKMGLAGHQAHTFGTNFAVNVGVALIGYVLCRGWRNMLPLPLGERAGVRDGGGSLNLNRDQSRATYEPPLTLTPSPQGGEGRVLHWQQGVTLVVIAILFGGVIGADVHLGLGAFAAAVVLIAVRAANEREAVRQLPWGVVLMVAGTSTLVAVAERTGGLKLFSQLLASSAGPETANGLIAFVTGIISIFSSTSGVVLPTFLPMVPELAANIPGTDPLALAMSVTIGSNLVDVSPVSTIGALCLAALPPQADRNQVFRQLLLWGVSMAAIGAIVCQFVL
ncbi:MAG: hypothetical protein HZA46_15065 [Planctomycetales bacterium]|nr:hypothetical protein [Planctomycetales bacterium]